MGRPQPASYQMMKTDKTTEIGLHNSRTRRTEILPHAFLRHDVHCSAFYHIHLPRGFALAAVNWEWLEIRQPQNIIAFPSNKMMTAESPFVPSSLSLLPLWITSHDTTNSHSSPPSYVLQSTNQCTRVEIGNTFWILDQLLTFLRALFLN